MISAEIILDIRRKTKKGYPVKIRVHETGKPHKHVSLKIYQNRKKLQVNPFLLNRAKDLDEEIRYCNDNNLELEAAVKVINRGLEKSKELEIFVLKQRLSELQQESGTWYLEFYDTIIKEKEKAGKSIIAFKDARREIVKFLGEGKDILINNVTYEFLNDFILFKKQLSKQKGNRPIGEGGLSYYLRNMRTVHKEAQRRTSLNIKDGNPFEGLIKNGGSRRDVRRLSAKDIRKLFFFEPKKGTKRECVEIMQKKIDMWLFQFAIGGHDFADMASLKWNDIYNGRVVFHRYKNRSKPGDGELIDNMLSDFALSVIDKHGTKDGDRVFSFIPEPSRASMYNNYRRNYAKSLERISDTLKIPRLKTKTPRYLFRSIAGELLISDIVVMKLQGHKPDGVTFRYQMDLPYKILDAEHQKILDEVFSNK